MRRDVYEAIVNMLFGTGPSSTGELDHSGPASSLPHSDMMDHVVMHFDDIAYDTVLAIVSQTYQARMRIRYSRLQRNPQSLLKRSHREDWLTLATEFDVAPCLVARLVLKHEYGWTGKKITQCLRQPEQLVNDLPLQTQIQQCVEEDEHYSPFVDTIRK